MFTSKQRSYLRGLASTIDPIVQIGKSGVTPEVTESVDEALEARELIKVAVLNNCDEEPKEISEILAGRTRSEVVNVIGKKIVLYRRSKKKATIELPK